ncbi:hypothetical protein POM88_000384 [Heracleum sosnowskyi]|uniref:Uncharacterized protein n=1 Tax=Heracleum sosnowskyi TaxID=360622 RepID=A0AAD8JB48_9APIA|nr:hypothetical protein POM88_000384 [Heracleum sosnowskyi]
MFSGANGWRMQITLPDGKIKMITSQFLRNRSLTELYVLNLNVVKEFRLNPDNEILVEYLDELIEENDVEVHERPYQIKYYRNKIVQSLDLTMIGYSNTRLDIYVLLKAC